MLSNSVQQSACLKIDFAEVFNQLLEQITGAHLL